MPASAVRTCAKRRHEEGLMDPNTSAMADPSSLDAFIDYARTQHDYTIQAEP